MDARRKGLKRGQRQQLWLRREMQGLAERLQVGCIQSPVTIQALDLLHHPPDDDDSNHDHNIHNFLELESCFHF